MTYILDPDGDYIKKCETNDCPNVILIGVSRQYCIKCLQAAGVKPYELEAKPIPYFDQKRFM